MKDLGLIILPLTFVDWRINMPPKKDNGLPLGVSRIIDSDRFPFDETNMKELKREAVHDYLRENKPDDPDSKFPMDGTFTWEECGNLCKLCYNPGDGDKAWVKGESYSEYRP